MNKTEAKKMLASVRKELEENLQQVKQRQVELKERQDKVKELRHVERYLAPLAGEKLPEEQPARYEPAKRGEMSHLLDLAADALAPGEPMTTAELADHVVEGGSSIPRGRIANYLTTMLARNPRFSRVGKGLWKLTEEG